MRNWVLVGTIALLCGGAIAVEGYAARKAVAQAVDARKAEADRLFQQGIQQYQVSRFEAAFESWEKALRLYREIKDRKGEGNALGGLGNAYYSLGNYPKAIDYHEQRLAIAWRILRQRSAVDDHQTYMIFTYWYCAVTASAVCLPLF
jgi:tetratricopeptide (TPR) repeat protein